LISKVITFINVGFMVEEIQTTSVSEIEQVRVVLKSLAMMMKVG
jgi:hypothetical protein